MPPTNRLFKLDHLSDINPKRLYENSRFKCRVHDVIDPRGRFGLEVIYPEEDERKFRQMFKLFRLCAAISGPAADRPLARLQRVAAFYRDDWHRAIVLNVNPPDSPNNNNNNNNNNDTIEVKFVDLGVRKRVLRHDHVRLIDEKFFNFPLKSVFCTVSVDEALREAMITAERAFVPMRLSIDAQKHFTTAIYEKVLYAKVLGIRDGEPVRIKLCYPTTNHGVIDIFMFTLSKYDRARYELIKLYGINKSQQRPAIINNG
jgi:hypothetical protein